MIKIENKALSRYLMFTLDKSENTFSEEELQTVEELVLNPINIIGEYKEIDLDIIRYFPNLKNISFRNLDLSNQTIENLSKIEPLKNVYFEKCSFENVNSLINLNIKEIEFINCSIADYSFIYGMPELNLLSITNGNISINGINKLKNLQYLKLSYSNVSDRSSLDLPCLKELHIDNTNIDNPGILDNLIKLEKISISEDQYNKNKSYFSNLSKKGIAVLNENMVEFSEEVD